MKKYLALLLLLACKEPNEKYEVTILTYPNREMICRTYVVCDYGVSLYDCEDTATGDKWDRIRCVQASLRKVQ